ncbi:MAG: serine/threonine-protein phosphatase [Ruminococcus sp.]|nr:serine/threonine-protein phosphatase [Ruminococcus sp.]
MNFLISGSTDIGLVKHTNQDSLNVRVYSSGESRVVLAVLCDGMGGLECGEIASASVIKAFCKWGEERLPYYVAYGVPEDELRAEWDLIINEMNLKIKSYGAGRGINLGTTLTAILLTDNKYVVVNVGDSRTYEIYDSVRCITQDQTLVAMEVRNGIITEEQAKTDPRRSVLLQCIGASDSVKPDFFVGQTRENAVYMLCSDGFRHEISEYEIYSAFNPDNMLSADAMRQNELQLIELNKQRSERDNISVITVRTY